jgi:hypothetical protein
MANATFASHGSDLDQTFSFLLALAAGMKRQTGGLTDGVANDGVVGELNH